MIAALIKLAAGFGLLGSIAEAAAPVMGSDPRQVFNTLLNVAAAAAAALAAQWVRDLRARTDSGQTPAAMNTDDLRETIVELREIAVTIREGLGRAGIIDQRAAPRSSSWPQDPGGRAS